MTRRWISTVGVLTQLMLLDTIIAMVTLTDIIAELGFGPGMLAWVVTAYTLAFGGLLLTGGQLGDSFDR